MIHLAPMTEDVWRSILDKRIPEYAAEQTRAGRWSVEEALEQANVEFNQLLPAGIDTAQHHIYSLVEQASDTYVGYLWYMEREKAGAPSVFLCDLRVFEAHRGKGYGKGALRELERRVLEQHGAQRIELHVFGANHVARALYTKMGFEETNVMMAKALS